MNLRGHVGKGAKEGADLYGHRNGDALFYLAHHIHILLFHLHTRHGWVGGNIVNIQLQPIGACLFNLLGIFNPATAGNAIEAANNWNIHRFFGLPDQLQIFVRPHAVAVHFGEIAQRFGKTLGAKIHIMI